VPGAELAASTIQSVEGRVRVMPRRSVQPPYPLERIPVDLRGFKGEAQRLVVYAFVNEKGEALNLRVVHGTGQAVDKTALATLGRWAFRPALKDDQPVAVEAIFGIPLQ
jgi:TonB-like protein